MKARAAGLAGVAVAALALAGCERPNGMTSQQTGLAGTGMAVVKNPRLVNFTSGYVPPPPYELEPDTGGERAREIYQNVPVLGHLSGDEFNRLMISITEWVSPEGKVANGGCNYCHNPENLASDEVYTKVVARRMLQMTMATNQNWQSHVKATGVTCWTCHRGNPVPLNVWNNVDEPGDGMQPAVLRGNKRGQNTPLPAYGYASLPYDGFQRYLAQTDPTEKIVKVASASAYPGMQNTAIGGAEATYGLMMHFATSLGVNCTYCHNTQSFRSYDIANPTKPLAWYAIRMTRDLNANYVTPLKPVFPANRLGPLGDPYKINCATCHQGLAKPMNGKSMLPDHPSLRGWPAGTTPVLAVQDPMSPRGLVKPGGPYLAAAAETAPEAAADYRESETEKAVVARVTPVAAVTR